MHPSETRTRGCLKAGWQIALVAVLTAGCAQNKIVNDPRAAVIGPEYLKDIAEYPRDRDTQYYYPDFTVTGLTNWVDPSPVAQNYGPGDIQSLLITIPPVPPTVRKIEGKGWPELEREGIPLFLPKQEQSW